jgi:outer membrane receptor protein involved in Fe transport
MLKFGVNLWEPMNIVIKSFVRGCFMVVPRDVPFLIKTAVMAIIYSFLFFTPGQSFAEFASDLTEADELLLFQDMTLVVSASRQKQPENLLSVPVTVLSTDDLHYGGHWSIPEALRFAPGVDVIRMDRNRYGIGIHGLEGMFSDRMMTLVDGMPADSPAFGGPEFCSLPIMMEDIERIEIVRGSGGGAWGANALSGVVNIITKDPGSVPGLFVTSSVSGFGDSSSQVRYGESTERLSWLLTVGYEDMKSSADILDLSSGDGGDDYHRRLSGRGELVYKTNRDVDLIVGAGFTGTNEGAFETAGIPATGDNDFKTANGYIKAAKVFNSDTEGYVRWAGRYQEMDRPSYGSARYEIREHDFEAQMNMTGFSQHSLAFGGNFRITGFDSRPFELDVFTLNDESVHEHWVGVFGSDRFQYSRQLLLEAQLRADYFSEGETDWSGRLSSIYGLDSSMDHIVRVSAAKSYRQPIGFIRNAVFSSNSEDAPYAFIFSVDPEMESEQAWSLESGYHWNIQEGIRFKTDIYYMWYENLIGGRPEYGTTETGLPMYHLFVDNTGGAKGYGAELELEYESGPLLLSVWYAYNDFATEHDHQSIRSFLPAKNKVGMNLRWVIDETWTFNGQFAYSDSIAEDVSDSSIDSANHLDLTISKSFLENKGEIMAGVLDLLNKEYDPIVGLDQTSGNGVPGRTFFCRVQYTF